MSDFAVSLTLRSPKFNLIYLRFLSLLYRASFTICLNPFTKRIKVLKTFLGDFYIWKKNHAAFVIDTGESCRFALRNQTLLHDYAKFCMTLRSQIFFNMTFFKGGCSDKKRVFMGAQSHNERKNQGLKSWLSEVNFDSAVSMKHRRLHKLKF